MKQAMIFAAGLGTRLKPLTDTMPKALVPIGGKPLLEHVLTKLVNEGYDDIVINIHHFADQIEQWVAQHPMQGVRIRLSDERQGLLETGGGIRHAAPFLQDSDRFLIHNVDILSNTRLADLEAHFKGEATLLVSDRPTQRYLIFDENMRLVGWTNVKTGEVRTPYPEVREALDGPYNLLAFAGIHLMSASLLPLMEKWPEKFSIIDFYLSVCREHPIYGYAPDDLRLMDVGKIDTLDQAKQFVESIN